MCCISNSNCESRSTGFLCALFVVFDWKLESIGRLELIMMSIKGINSRKSQQSRKGSRLLSSQMVPTLTKASGKLRSVFSVKRASTKSCDSQMKDKRADACQEIHSDFSIFFTHKTRRSTNSYKFLSCFASFQKKSTFPCLLRALHILIMIVNV